MNQNWKQQFRKMNLDSDVRTMQGGEYRKLTNGTPISPASSSYENAVQDIVTNVVGNALITNTLPGGTNKAIGCLQDRKSNRFFWCNWNNTIASQAIYKYENGSVVTVMQTNLFDWLQTDFVDMDIVGDVLIFTNNRSEIKKINIAKAIAGGTYTPLANQITLIKPPPLLPLTFTLSYDNAKDTNFLAGNYFQFFYRYIYEDFDYSVFSPSSDVTNCWLHPSGLDVDYLANSTITLSGPQSIDGGFRTTGNRILLVNQFTPTDNGIWIYNSGGAWTRAADFSSGSVDTTVYVKSGNSNANQIWRIRSTNVGVDQPVSNKIEGPNKLTINVPVTAPSTVTGIDYAVRVNGTNEFFVYRQEKTTFSTSHTFYNDTYIFTVPDSDTFKFSDAIPLKSKSLKIFKNRPFLFNNVEGYNHSTSTSVTLTTQSISLVITKAFKVFKNGSSYNVGIIFSDGYRRNSGVVCINSITIPSLYGFLTEGLYYGIRVDTSPIVTDVPSWATHFTIVQTKNLETTFFISAQVQDIYYYNKSSAGVFTYSKTLTSFKADGTVIDIGSLEKNGVGYTFQKGDRIKLSVGETGGQPVDVEILQQDGRFVFVRVLNEIRIQPLVGDIHRFEIYTPSTNKEAPFYEVKTYAIASIGGLVDLIGDIDIGIVTDYSHRNVGTYSGTDPFANNYEASGPTSVAMMSIWDKNFPSWTSQSGRPLIKSDSRQINKYTSIRWGQQYILNANFLGINTFYALDEQALPIENGPGTQLAEAGEVLVAVHEIETEAVYVGQGFVNTSSGNNFLAKTEGVIGDNRRYLGGHGSIHQASVVSREGKVYFLNLRKGMVVRRSQDGLTVISDYGIRGLISTLCNTHAALATSRIVAGWDPQYDCYCLSFQDTADSSGITLYWHEKSNGWVFQTNLLPELFGLFNQRQIAFKNGAIWQQTFEGNYNNWFGVQYNRTLEMEFSPLSSLVHIWDGIEIDSEKIYVTAGANEDVVLLYNKNGDTLQTRINYLDFVQREGVWRSAFFRWIGDNLFASATESKYKSPKRIRGQSAFMVVKYNGTDRNPMKSITIFYTPSMQSQP